MWRFLLPLTLLPAAGFACGAPVCLVDPDDLVLMAEITFDDQPSGMGPGRRIDDPLALPGATFAEGFIGQLTAAEGPFDRVTGPAASPLTIRAGAPGQTLTILRLGNTNVLNGTGPAGWPKDEAVGEGAVAILFDRDQQALALDLRGGEDGSALILFLRRDGVVLHEIEITGLAEARYGFARSGFEPDIAGLVITNDDPEGIAIDNVAFDLPDASS